MRIVHSYEEFCAEYDRGNVEPDLSSRHGAQAVETLLDEGWEIDFWTRKRDLLRLCRQSKANFDHAFAYARVDFRVKSED